MAHDDNPFEPGADERRESGEHDPGTKAPVPMDIGPILQRAWELFTENLGVVLGAILIPFFVSLFFQIPSQIAQVAADGMQDEGQALILMLVGQGANIVGGLINLFLQLGVVRIFANVAYGREVDITMLFGEGDKYLYALAAGILLFIGVFFGLILLIVPGIILALGTQFYMYALVDQELGPIEALQESWRLTDGYKLFLFGFGIILAIGAVGVACLTCGIGYILALPMLSLVQAVMYHSLMHLQGDRYDAILD